MKKLLNIDGGGVRVYLSLLILDYIEKRTNKKIIDLFDYYSGVSASSVILSALLIDYSVQEILDLFKIISKKIFYKSWTYTLTSLFGIYNSKYPDYYINSEFEAFFKDNKLSDVKKPLSILTYDLYDLKPKCFHSYKDDNHYPLWQIIRGSTSAPIYFPPFNLDSYLLIDGGLVTNNLTELVFTNALSYFGKDEEFFQLSLGCGFLNPNLYGTPSGLWSWSSSLLNIMTNGTGSLEISKLKKISNINNLKHYHRLNIDLDIKIALDDYTAFNKMDVIFNRWLESNKETLDKLCDELVSL